MKNIFKILDIKAMLQLNVASIIITGICVAFATSIFITKGQQPELEHWKYVAIIIGLVIVSLLFIGSIATFILFVRMKNKKN
jgi:heme/copper-type cytochrome/quinol oxidase subunit 2